MSSYEVKILKERVLAVLAKLDKIEVRLATLRAKIGEKSLR